jgi:4-hydroxy-tetrahydrodipicolinate synthase
MDIGGGLIVATLTPFKEDLSIHWDELARCVRALDAVPGVTGFAVNAFAAEVPALSEAERQRVVAVHRESASPDKVVISALLGWSPPDVVRTGLQAREAGADAVMICAPYLSAYNAAHSPRYAVKFHVDVARALKMPMVLFQLASGDQLSYPHEALVEMARDIDEVIGVKMAQAHDCVRYDRDYYALKALDKQVACLPSVASSLFQNLCTGADGVLTGLGSFAPYECVEMYQLVKNGDFAAAQALHRLLAPLNHAIYGFPYADLHTRYKEVAYILGAISSPEVRSPQMRMSPDEVARLRALAEAARIKPLPRPTARRGAA